MPYRTNANTQHVWEKAKPIKGKNPNLYRIDSFGNTIYKAAYGRNSRLGWQIDHIFPKSKGGPNRKRNLQALQTSANRKKSNKVMRKRKAGSRTRRHR